MDTRNRGTGMIFAALLIFAFGAVANADTISIHDQATSGAGVLTGCNNFSGFGGIFDPIQLSVSGPGCAAGGSSAFGTNTVLGEGPVTTSKGFSGSTGSGPGTITGSGFGSSADGAFGASAQLTVACSATQSNPTCGPNAAYGFAAFTDTIDIIPSTVQFADLNGSFGTLSLTYDVHGSTSGSNGGGLLAFATLGGGSSYFCSDGPDFMRCPSVSNYNGTGLSVNYVTECNLTSSGSCGGFGHYGFVFGEPFDLTTFFGALVIDAGTTSLRVSHTDTISADFADTMQITGIQILDSNGSAVNGWSIVSGAGLDYSPNGISSPTTVPEPSTFLLLGGVLVAIGFRSRRIFLP